MLNYCFEAHGSYPPPVFPESLPDSEFNFTTFVSFLKSETTESLIESTIRPGIIATVNVNLATAPVECGFAVEHVIYFEGSTI